MKYCTRCLYPQNHPLGIIFDHEGVCSGCRVHEEKDMLDWNKRAERLKAIFDIYRSKSGSSYDCIIPVSGARDSFFIVHTVKKIFGMHPLLVTYNKHYNTDLGIRNLAKLRTYLGCDILTLTVSPETVKKITLKTMDKLGSIYWHCLAGQSVYPVQMAVKLKVPLIVWGAHQGCDQVGMFSHLDEVEMTRKYRKNHDLMGLEAEDLIGSDAYGLTEDDMTPFIYPHDKEIERVGVRGIYLSNYIRWDTKQQHETMMKLYGYESHKQHRTFDTYNDVDCFHYSDLHDYIKFMKWGYGKASDHASREIRLKRLTREQGIDLVQQHQNSKPTDQGLALFLNWLKISAKEFWKTIDKHRNSSIWHQKTSGEWDLTDSVLSHRNDPGIDSVRLMTPKNNFEFLTTEPPKPGNPDDQYILIGKGWPS